jgi:V-type H+-transporting ATPase subunit E
LPPREKIMSTPLETPALSLAEFVIQEAKEKVFEIDIKSLKQFEKDKEAIVQKEITVVREEFEKKMRVKEMEEKM